jgi:anti-sigma B factor antagonist
MLRLKCVRCGLAVPYKGSKRDLCPRCQVRDGQAVALIPVSDQPASTAIAGRLMIRSKSSEGALTISLSGELDVASAQMLEETLLDGCSSGASEIVLDLSGVEFMDSTGLSAILRGKAICDAHGCAYSLTPAQRPVDHVFRTTGVRGRLRFRSPRGTGSARGGEDTRR